ncbi:MAG: class I SAM-dependent methyltransferase [Syntrophomonadaceae bacterium]|nr:class I SAM-dependent methyltransferase [Syntrophomonadaceae bacterium]MDD3890146.1 class I SAM-dependent methyltransferase [Syntrophomonadaceae bacterium]MDD4549257.1 class I SAM-dependent methyltransferase [Syntrophomonadaceae bacterium]
MEFIATTTGSIKEVDSNFAAFLEESGVKYVPRNRRSLGVLAAENGARGVIVWHANGPVLYIGDNKFYFHPSMAKVRLSAYRNTGTLDPMIKAFAIEEDDKILDCTLGLGADAVVASYFAPQGEITGIESSTTIAGIIKWGMKLYQSGMPWLDNAIKKIEVINSEHYTYLKQQQDNSYDIVYFDPMFRKPLLKSQPLSGLRVLANHEPLSPETIKEAIRVARKRVVIKEMVSSLEFERLKCQQVLGSPNNKIAFGVILV